MLMGNGDYILVLLETISALIYSRWKYRVPNAEEHNIIA